ncbi:MAG TPA: CcoQ/FixQ family Cbb3-type cytochrome c oxidase assembly chaperone [Anaeromyxobacter sp.]|nr:CcoQ/FixQ family Cbb3-type cytochrome c oxidase assembly chaperone [Anaeromyxobacter sp.]
MGPEVAYAVLGGTLCLLLALIAAFYYRRSRKDRVEGPKYKMLEDDDRS